VKKEERDRINETEAVIQLGPSLYANERYWFQRDEDTELYFAQLTHPRLTKCRTDMFGDSIPEEAGKSYTQSQLQNRRN
jgi:hypothetical protein